MKKTFTLLFALLFSIATFAQEIIAEWTFPSGVLTTDLIADVANGLNTDKTLFTEGGTSAIEMKNGLTTFAAQASGWDDGIDTKSWQTEVNTTGRGSIFVSSAQTAGTTNPGPKDFKLQYKIGAAGVWTDVAGGNVTVANDWTTGVLDRLALPADCDNQASVFIRWVMTSNLDINGATLISSGKGKIDDIIIESDVLLALENLNPEGSKMNVFPSPCTDYFEIETSESMQNVSLYTTTGSLIYEVKINANKHRVITSEFKKGAYVVVLRFKENNRTETKTMIIN